MNELIDLHEFARLVRHALAALYDYPRLQELPLAELLVGDQPELARGPALHHLLLQTIEDLKPSTPQASNPAARRYQYLYLRYVDVRSISDVATMLGVSLRQARRDHHDAVDVLASRLYEVYRARHTGVVPPVTSAPGPVELTLATEAQLIGLSDFPGSTNCDEVIASVIETLTPLAATRGIQLRQAPSSRVGVTPIDRALARQILINAVGYTLSIVDHGEVVIASGVSPRGVAITIEFCSSGDSSDASTRLAVCRHLVTIAHGDIRLHWSGDAARIEILLPGAVPATVLVVDDNPDVRQLFRRYLAGGRYRVVEASGFDDALEIVRNERPDVMTIDVMLPTRDGWELLQRVKQDAQCAEIPVIVCSVLRERDLAFALGAADFLEKPVIQQSLLTAIARQLERRTPLPRRASPEDTAAPHAR